MICPIAVLWTKGAQMNTWGMLAHHEEISRQKQGGRKNPSSWVFPQKERQV